jgi:hypothetical protein
MSTSQRSTRSITTCNNSKSTTSRRSSSRMGEGERREGATVASGFAGGRGAEASVARAQAEICARGRERE